MKVIPLSDGTLLKSTLEKIEALDIELGVKVTNKLIVNSDFYPGKETGLTLFDSFIKYVSSIAKDEMQDIAEVKPATIICCADHGVAKMQVSAYPQETTLHMTTNYLIAKGAAANAFSNFINSSLLVADFGINAETYDLPELLYRKIAYGTCNIAEGPAMTRQQAITVLEEGIKIANECNRQGFNVIIPGEMGISNTTSSAAIVAAICQLTPQQATGRGTNISDTRLKNKQKIVEQILKVNHPDPNDGLDILTKIGGFELGAITGLILGAAANKITVAIDGLNTAAAALMAVKINPLCQEYIFASHLGGEPAHAYALNKLDLYHMMKMDFRLGEGLGSSLTCDILAMMVKAYNNILAQLRFDEKSANIQDNDNEDDDDSINDIIGDLQEIKNMINEIINQPKSTEKSFIVHTEMPDTTITLSDKTFNYYTMTMGSLNKKVMAKCQARINNLAKPIYSLGKIEHLAVELAGITNIETPDINIKKALFTIGFKPEAHNIMPLLHSFVKQSNSKLVQAALKEGHSNDDAFEFGRSLSENHSLCCKVIALSILTKDVEDSQNILNILKDEHGNLKYSAGEFLKHIPQYYQLHVSTFLGALLAAAHNHTLIILDDELTNIIATYAIQLCPDLQPYILPLTPELYQLRPQNSNGIIAAIGLRLIDATLHMINDMKTFSETQVAIANDGPGAIFQS